MSVARSSSDMFTIDRLHCISKGFSSPLKMHYWPRNGDGNSRRGQSMLSAIALLVSWSLTYLFSTNMAISETSDCLVMAVLHSRCGHYIFVL